MMAVSTRSWRALRLSIITRQPGPHCVVRWKWRLLARLVGSEDTSGPLAANVLCGNRLVKDPLEQIKMPFDDGVIAPATISCPLWLSVLEKPPRHRFELMHALIAPRVEAVLQWWPTVLKTVGAQNAWRLILLG